MKWYPTARKLLWDLEKTLPPSLSPDDRRQAYIDAYPFGERKYHPYKEWLKALKDHKRDMEKLRTFSG